MLNMLDTTTWANGNQSVVIAVTTSELAIVNQVKKKAYAQPTSILPSSGRSSKIFDMHFVATYESQIHRAFIPPLDNISSRKATNSLKREYFEEVGESDTQQNMKRTVHPNNKLLTNILNSDL
ncbi:MAG: hypothetical protein EZS28_053358, partial [Streblomastix strix]